MDEDNGLFDFVRYDPAVEEAINEVFPSDDPMDRPDFDPIKYINECFPSEQSLGGLDSFVAKLRVKVKHLDDDIQTSIRNQTRAGLDGGQALADARKGMADLFSRIRDIRAKAELSEKMVQEITRDIKSLDIAKGNLTKSISSLNHLHMLVGSIDRLNDLTRNCNYAEAAHHLSAVVDVLNHFSKHTDIERIRDFASKIESIKQMMVSKITVEFRTAFPTPKPDIERCNSAQLLQACALLDVLDSKVKKDIVDWFFSLQLKEYYELFASQTEAAWIDKIDRRYTWFKKALMLYDENCTTIFPPEWNMSLNLAMRFCEITRDQLQQLLQLRKPEIDVKVLLYAIQKTTEFEQFLNRKFNPGGIQPEDPKLRLDLDEPQSEADDIRAKYLRQRKQQMAKEAKEVEAKKPPSVLFTQKILSVFERVLDVYIGALDQQLTDQLTEANRTFKTDLAKSLSGEEASETIVSSIALMQFVKDRMSEASKFGTPKVYDELYRLFKKHFKSYAQRVLNPNLPRFQSLPTLQTADVRLAPDEIAAACRILNTADYCVELTTQLQTKIADRVDPSLKASVDLSEETASFTEVIQNTISLLVRSLETQCDAALSAMLRMHWDTIDDVGDASPFVASLGKTIAAVVPPIRTALSQNRKYFNNFCIKFATSFVPRVLSTLYKLRSISPVGAEQLLLDVQSIKPILMDLPSVATDQGKQNPATFTRIIQTGVTKAEKIVKLLMSPHDNHQLFVDDYMKLLGTGEDAESGAKDTEFQKILEMKGLKRPEQMQLLHAFQAKVGAARTAPPTSSVKQRLAANPALNTVTSSISSGLTSLGDSLKGAKKKLVGGGGGAS